MNPEQDEKSNENNQYYTPLPPIAPCHATPKRSKLRPTVSLINPNVNSTNIPKSAPVTPLNPAFNNKDSLFGTNLPRTQCDENQLKINPSPQNDETPLPQNNKTIIIFDWDDTLLPSHCLAEYGLRPKSKPNKEEKIKKLNENERLMIMLGLKQLEIIINELLTMAICRVGAENVFIITNAERGWVELSCSTFIPNIMRMVKECTIISARSTFEQKYPSSTIEWKRRAIKMVLDRRLNININIDKVSVFKEEGNALKETSVNVQNKRAAIDNLHVVSFGDSLVERQAVFDVTKCINFKDDAIKCIKTKSVKLLPCPTINQLVDELKTIKQSFGSILSHQYDLDYQVQVGQ